MANESKVKLWTRDFILVTLSRTFSALMFMMLSATIATVAFERYQSSVSEAGVLVGAFIMGAMVSRVFAGRYTEVIGRRRLLVVGHFVMLLLSFLYFIPMGPGWFLLVRVLHGISFGMATNTTQVVGASYVPQERWGEGMGFFSLSSSLSCALGPFVGLLLLQISIEAMFAFSTLCCLVSFLFTLPLHIEPGVTADEDEEEACGGAGEGIGEGIGEGVRTGARRGFRLQDYFEVKAIPIAALLMVWSICYAGMNSFVNTYGGLLGLASTVPLFFVLHSAANLVSRMPVGKLFDRMGANVVVLPSVACFIVSLVMLSFCSGPVMLVLSGMLSGLGYGSLFFMIQTLVMKVAPPHRMGVASSTFFVFADTGSGLGPLIMGLVHPLAGYPGMYAIAAVICVLTIPVYFMVHGRKARQAR